MWAQFNHQLCGMHKYSHTYSTNPISLKNIRNINLYMYMCTYIRISNKINKRRLKRAIKSSKTFSTTI